MTNEEILEAEARQLNRSCSLVDSAGVEVEDVGFVSLVVYKPDPTDCPNGKMQHQVRLAVGVGDVVAQSMVLRTWFETPVLPRT